MLLSVRAHRAIVSISTMGAQAGTEAGPAIPRDALETLFSKLVFMRILQRVPSHPRALIMPWECCARRRPQGRAAGGETPTLLLVLTSAVANLTLETVDMAKEPKTHRRTGTLQRAPLTHNHALTRSQPRWHACLSIPACHARARARATQLDLVKLLGVSWKRHP